jgi:hypothetical protein
MPECLPWRVSIRTHEAHEVEETASVSEMPKLDTSPDREASQSGFPVCTGRFGEDVAEVSVL